jgi:Fur family ferric uptake transcriptional regulator
MSHEFSLSTIEVALSPQERFEEYLQSRGLRCTEQRKFLVDQVFNKHQHFDADQLIDQLPRKGEPGYVSRPTVYRTLKEFVDAGLLRRFDLSGRTVYEHDYGYPQHDHLYCVRCQKLIEFHSQPLSDMLEQIARQKRFRVRHHRLIIHGVCQECNQRRSGPRRKQDLV